MQKRSGQGELRWVQTGMGPNYKGGLMTLTACRHEKRCTSSVKNPARDLQGDGTSEAENLDPRKYEIYGSDDCEMFN